MSGCFGQPGAALGESGEDVEEFLAVFGCCGDVAADGAEGRLKWSVRQSEIIAGRLVCWGMVWLGV